MALKGINYFYFLFNDMHAYVIKFLMNDISKNIINSNNPIDIRCNKHILTNFAV